jgi:Ribbon-helix-helix protein, copG family
MEVAAMDDRDLTRELHDHRGDPDEWEDTPAEVKVRPARSEVVSFRLPSEQLNEIEALATRMGQSISEFIRNAVLAYVRGEVMTPVLDVQTGGPGRLQFTMRTRLPSSGYTSTEPPDWVPSEPITTVTCID